MPDASVSSLVYKLASLQRNKNQGGSNQNNPIVSEDALPREPSPALLESHRNSFYNNTNTNSWGTPAYNSEKKAKELSGAKATPSNLLEEASSTIFPGLSNHSTGWFMNICESCGAAHDGLYGSGRFCSKHCAKGVGARCKWNMVKANTNHSKDTHHFSSDSNTERKTTDFGNTKTANSSDPLRRLCLLAESEKKLLTRENVTSKPELETKFKKRLYRYQRWLLEQQRNCYVMDDLERGTESVSDAMDDSRVLEKEPSLEEVVFSKGPEWINEIPTTTSPSIISSCEEPTSKLFQEHSEFSVENLLNLPTESFESSSTSFHDGQWRLPPFTTLEKAAEEGDRELASRKWYPRWVME